VNICEKHGPCYRLADAGPRRKIRGFLVKFHRIMTRYQKGPDAKKEQLDHRPVEFGCCGSCGRSAIRDPITAAAAANIVPAAAKLAPVHAIRGTMAGKLARDPAGSNIDPAAAARGP